MCDTVRVAGRQSASDWKQIQHLHVSLNLQSVTGRISVRAQALSARVVRGKYHFCSYLELISASGPHGAQPDLASRIFCVFKL